MTTTPPTRLHPGPRIARPLFQDACPAGFPSPASDYVERMLDLNELVDAANPAVYFVWAQGRSEMRAGIWSGDLLVLNAALAPQPGNLVVAFVDGEHTVKRFCRDHSGAYLSPDPLPEEARDYAVIRPHDGEEMIVCGVVTHSVRAFRGGA